MDTIYLKFVLLIFFAIFIQISSFKNFESINCTFDVLFNSLDSNFCNWHPADESSAQLWHTGNAVIVDSANFVVPLISNLDQNQKTKRINRFAFVQGNFEAKSEGSLESPLINPQSFLKISKELKLLYWKIAPLPSLDICIKNEFDMSLNCIDTIAGPGQKQWIQRSIEIPVSEVPFRIVLRAKNIISAEDIICIDDLYLIDSSTKSIYENKTYNFGIKNSRSNEFFDKYNQSIEKLNEIANLQNNEEDMETTTHSYVKVEKNRLSVLQPKHKSIFLTEKREPYFGETIFRKNMLNLNNKLNFNNFPMFPSLSEGMTVIRRTDSHHFKKNNNGPILIPEASEFCRALKCNFLESTCLWSLGNTWKKTDGSIVRETIGEDVVQSAFFKPPLGSFLEFDLWMSENSLLTVVEDMEEPILENIVLFSQRGMANNGFHRFRVPLRSSFRPIQIKFRSILPADSFVAISNTRMVNRKNEEISCETTKNNNLNKNWQKFETKNDDFIKSNLNSVFTNEKNIFKPIIKKYPDLLTNALFPTLPPLTTASILDKSTINPFLSLITYSTPQFNMFNPFKPTIEPGLTPIVPVKDDPIRLTTIQKPPKFFKLKKRLLKQNNGFHQINNFLPHYYTVNNEQNDDKQFAYLKQQKIFNSKFNNNQNNRASLKTSISSIPKTFMAQIKNFENNFTNKNENKIIKKTNSKEVVNNNVFDFKIFDTYIKNVAGKPHLEQQLKNLIQKLSVNSSSISDVALLHQILGLKLSNISDIENLSALNTLLHLIPLTSNQNNRQRNFYSPPPSPFDAPKIPFFPNKNIKNDNLYNKKKTVPEDMTSLNTVLQSKLF